MIQSLILMNLFEVIFNGCEWNGTDEDTIYLVRANNYKEAVSATRELHRIHLGKKHPMPDVVFEIGSDLTQVPEPYPCVLRGPYYQCAYNHGWKVWYYYEEEKVYKNKFYTEEP